MLKNTVLGFLMVLACTMTSTAYAGKVELTTYYPAPSGEYDALQSNQTCVGTNCVATDVGTGNLRVKRNTTTSAGGDLTVDNDATISGTTTLNGSTTLSGTTTVSSGGSFVIQPGAPTAGTEVNG